jgi:hypothetical protein
LPERVDYSVRNARRNYASGLVAGNPVAIIRTGEPFKENVAAVVGLSSWCC